MKRSTQLLLLSAFRRRIGSLWEDRDFDTILRHKHIHVFVFSMIGLLAMVVTQLVTWSVTSTSTYYKDAYVDDPSLSATTANLLYLSQAVVTSSTLVTIVLITQKYRLLLTMKRAEWSGAHLTEVEDLRGDTVLRTAEREHFVQSYNFWRGGMMKWKYFAEVCVHVPHPILWMASVSSSTTPSNIGYKLLQTWMFTRLYLVPGIFHLLSPAFQKRFEVVTNDAALLRVGYRIRPSLTLKILFYQNTAIGVVAGLVGVILVFGFGTFTMERQEGSGLQNNAAFSSYWNSIWFAFVSATTVGYGDYAPTTPFGRTIAAADVVVGVGLFTLFSGVLVSRVSLSKEQKHGVEFIATRHGDDMYRQAARRLRTVFLMDVCLPAWDRAHDRSKEFSKRHKGNRLHQAVSGLRAARRELNGAFMQADDTVVSEKLEALDDLMCAIDREVAQHQAQLADFDKETELKIRSIVQKVSHFKRDH